MREMALIKRISVAIGCVLVAACGGGSSGSGEDSAPTLATNSPPHIVGAPPVIAQVGQPYEFAPTATDADGDTLTFAIENRPEWATFSPITGKLEGTPPPTASPVYPRIRISVSDGKAISELPAFDLRSRPVDQYRAHDRWAAGKKRRRGQLLRIHPAGI